MKARSPKAKRVTRSAPARAARKTPASRAKSHDLLRGTLDSVSRRLLDERILRPGVIAFHDPGDASANFCLHTVGQHAEIIAGTHADPILEVVGDPARLRSIIEGKKDGRLQFFAGGISIRGDMHYLSELGLALGFLKSPLV